MPCRKTKHSVLHRGASNLAISHGDSVVAIGTIGVAPVSKMGRGVAATTSLNFQYRHCRTGSTRIRKANKNWLNRLSNENEGN